MRWIGSEHNAPLLDATNQSRTEGGRASDFAVLAGWQAGKLDAIDDDGSQVIGGEETAAARQRAS